jgi:hypothetical protein
MQSLDKGDALAACHLGVKKGFDLSFSHLIQLCV